MEEVETLQETVTRHDKELEIDSLEQKLKKVFATRSEFEALNTEIDG